VNVLRKPRCLGILLRADADAASSIRPVWSLVIAVNRSANPPFSSKHAHMITLRRIDPVQAIGRAVYRDGVAVGGGPASSMAKELPVGRTAYWRCDLCGAGTIS
jgi:hypothetical protein